MWRKLKFLHMWIYFKFLHMTDAEKSEISFVVCTIYGILLHFTLFCCKICIFLVFYAVLSQNRFLWFTRYCVEKNLAKNSSRGEKMTNMRYEHLWICWPHFSVENDSLMVKTDFDFYFEVAEKFICYSTNIHTFVVHFLSFSLWAFPPYIQFVFFQSVFLWSVPDLCVF